MESNRLPNLRIGYGKFSCIYADPPWSYKDEKCGGGLDDEYPTMGLNAICDLPVGHLAKEDGAHLWMWTTWPMIRDRAPHKVLDAWGFRWVGEIVWFKGERIGVGRWLRPSTEILVLAEKGKKRLERYNQRGHVFECSRGKHSRKPDKFYEVIESLSEGPYIELFARRDCDILNSQNRKGWSYWGKEA